MNFNRIPGRESRFKGRSFLKIFLAATFLNLSVPVDFAHSQESSSVLSQRLLELDKFTEKIRAMLSNSQLDQLEKDGLLPIGEVEIHVNNLSKQQKTDLVDHLNGTITELEDYLKTFDPFKEKTQRDSLTQEIAKYRILVGYFKQDKAPQVVRPIKFKLSINSTIVGGHHSYDITAYTSYLGRVFRIFLEKIPSNARLFGEYTNFYNF